MKLAAFNATCPFEIGGQNHGAAGDSPDGACL